MSITLRGSGTTGPNSHATSTSISLPTGVTTGDVSFIIFVQANNSPLSGMQTLTPPSGWTVLHSSGGVAVVWRAFQSGDATTGITCSSTVTDWWESACVAYTGLDTTNPIDAFNFSNQVSFQSTFGGNNNTVVCPSINPNYAGSLLLCFMAGGGSSSGTLAIPSGMTSRASVVSGPMCTISDLALTDGTPTGVKTGSTTTNTGALHFGMQVALKASGAAGTTLAAAVPVVCGRTNIESNLATQTIQLDWMNVQDKDLVVVWYVNGDSSHPSYTMSPPAGWTTHLGAASGQLFSRLWSTGDSKTPSFTQTGSAYQNYCAVVIRKTGSSANGVVVDQVSANVTSGSSPQTGTTPSLTPAQTHELLLVMIGANVTSAMTWSSVTGGLDVIEDVAVNGPGSRFSWLQTPASPTGSFSATATITGTIPLSAVTMLVKIGSAGGGAVVRPSVFACT